MKFSQVVGVILVALAGFGASLCSSTVAYGQAVEVEDEQVGQRAARQYFVERKPQRQNLTARRPSSYSDHYMAFHVGGYLDDKAYRWGGDKVEDVGQATVGVTYRIGEWVNSMDLLFRADINTWNFKEENPVKLSLLPMIVFPDATSEFPIYFGAGAGLGVFFKQLDGESELSFDYQLVTGARFFNLFNETGFLFEMGLKNHIHLLSNGQFNGVFAALGVVFNF